MLTVYKWQVTAVSNAVLSRGLLFSWTQCRCPYFPVPPGIYQKELHKQLLKTVCYSAYQSLPRTWTVLFANTAAGTEHTCTAFAWQRARHDLSVDNTAAVLWSCRSQNQPAECLWHFSPALMAPKILLSCPVADVAYHMACAGKPSRPQRPICCQNALSEDTFPQCTTRLTSAICTPSQTLWLQRPHGRLSPACEIQSWYIPGGRGKYGRETLTQGEWLCPQTHFCMPSGGVCTSATRICLTQCWCWWRTPRSFGRHPARVPLMQRATPNKQLIICSAKTNETSLSPF